MSDPDYGTWPSHPARSQAHYRELRRNFNKPQIFMIVISTTVGIGYIVNAGEILAIGGPGTLILAFASVGLLSCMVMEGISEMTILWPVPNPMAEFVRCFVDEDLAMVVCFAYWYMYSTAFAAIITVSGELVQYWVQGDSTFSKVVIYIFYPILAFSVNMFNNKWFGYIELVGGGFKLFIIAFVFFLMLAFDAGAGSQDIGDRYINDGFQNDPKVTDSPVLAFLISLPLAAFPYIGVESVTATAFEAKTPRQLTWTGKYAAYMVTILYTASVTGFALNVSWRDPKLPPYSQQSLVIESATLEKPSVLLARDSSKVASTSWALPVVALSNSNAPPFAALVNACLLISALSSANSTLFVASRTLFGWGRHAHRNSEDDLIQQFIAKFGKLTDEGVPALAVAASCVCFVWLPFISLAPGLDAAAVQDAFFSVGSTSCIVVWATQCGAFLRYYTWLKKHEDELTGPQYRKFNRWRRTDCSSLLGCLQPFLAWTALFACIILALGLGAVSYANHKNYTLKTINLFLGPGVMILIITGLKLKRTWPNPWENREDALWVRLGSFQRLNDTIAKLTDLSEDSFGRVEDSNDRLLD